MTPERRALVHRALVGPLTQRGAPAARIAEHAERGGDRAAACRWRLLALDAARRRFALGDVLAEAERVLALDPSPAQAIAAHLARAAALRQRADRAGADAALATATRLLDAADSVSLHVAVMQERASSRHCRPRPEASRPSSAGCSRTRGWPTKTAPGCGSRAANAGASPAASPRPMPTGSAPSPPSMPTTTKSAAW